MLEHLSKKRLSTIKLETTIRYHNKPPLKTPLSSWVKVEILVGFVKDFGKIEKHLIVMLRKDNVIWNSETTLAFTALKKP